MTEPIPARHHALRPFGRAEDLELELGDRDRPALVTALLARCSEPGDEERWWALPVGDRIAGLLRLVALTESVDHLTVPSRCPQPSCGAAFEFELPLAALLGPTRGADPTPIADATPCADPTSRADLAHVVLPGQRSVSVRRPRGRDLRAWRLARPASRQAGVAAMLATLVQGGLVTPADEPALADALAAMDPLVALTVSCGCPACEAPIEVPVDLEGLALARLGARQRTLLREVHQLASRYGWTEAEVLAVSPARRARYLALIESER